MSFFSRSRSKGHYPSQNHGSGHYKRPHSSGGILGKIFKALIGSKRHSQSGSNHNKQHDSNHNNGHSNRHQRKDSWS